MKKLIITALLLLTGCATQGTYYAQTWWIPDPDCKPVKTVTWYKYEGSIEDVCGNAGNVFKEVRGCVTYWGNEAYVQSIYTEAQAKTVDSGGISHYEHEMRHIKQCLKHPNP